jgi:hypothetical protein
MLGFTFIEIIFLKVNTLHGIIPHYLTNLGYHPYFILVLYVFSVCIWLFYFTSIGFPGYLFDLSSMVNLLLMPMNSLASKISCLWNTWLWAERLGIS